MKIIAVCGKAGSGKDTFGDIACALIRRNGEKAIKFSYAGLLKYICKTFFGWNGEKDQEGRELLQYIGTDVVRARRRNYWVEFLTDLLDLIGDKIDADYIIITDARFKNEIDYPKERGYDVTTIELIRPDYISGLTDEQKAHRSETELDDYKKDYTIINEGSMHDLYLNVKQVLEDMSRVKLSKVEVGK